MISSKHIAIISISTALLSGCASGDGYRHALTGLSSAQFHANHPTGEMQQHLRHHLTEGSSHMNETRHGSEHGKMFEHGNSQMGQRSQQINRNERTEQRFGYEERSSQSGSSFRIKTPSPWHN